MRFCARRPTRCRCVSATTASSRISRPRGALASSRRVLHLPGIALGHRHARRSGALYGARAAGPDPHLPLPGRPIGPSDGGPGRPRMMSAEIPKLLARALDGKRPDARAALLLAECDDLDPLMQAAAELRDRGHGRLVSYSRKVFIPAHPAVPRLLPLLHLRASAAQGRARLPHARRGAGHRARRAARPAARRRCSRSATSRSCATAWRARSWRPRREATLDYLARMAALVLERDRPAAASQSRRDDAPRRSPRCGRVGVAGHHAGDRGGAAVRSAAGRTSARPTRCRPCGSRRSRPPARRRCRSPPAS